jgi:hypothetical protein
MSKFNDLTGQKLGKLTVLWRTENRGKYVMWTCQCDCGKQKAILSSSLAQGKTKSCGCAMNESKGRNLVDLRGMKIGRLTVLHPEGKDKYGHILWLCLCDCGKTKIIMGPSLRHKSHPTQSCGCLVKEIAKKNLPAPHENGSYGKRGKENFNWKGYGELSFSYFGTLKRGAKKRNIAFNLTIEGCWQQFLKQNRRCALTNLPIQFFSFRDVCDGTASLDRIDSAQGYSKENVQWVHKDVNFMKQDFTQEDFINYCKLVAKNFSQKEQNE